MSETDWGQWSADGSTVETTTDEVPEEIIEDNMSLFAINDLGEYELLKIFSYFSLKERMSLSRVCLKWKICINKTFKTETVFNVDTIGSSTGMSEKAVCLLIQKCCNVRDISLRGLFMFKTTALEECDSIVNSIVANCSHLQSMDFGSYDEFDELFIKNANYFRRLKKISSVNISGTALNLIIDSENLESIDIKRNDKISELDFKRLGPKVRQLELTESDVTEYDAISGLSEGNGRQIEKLSIDIKAVTVLTLICDHLLKLKDLKICLYSDNCDFKRFSNLVNLKSLEIEVMDNSSLKATEFIDLVRALRPSKITNFRIDLSPVNNIAVTDESLQEIRINCPLIEKLVIRGANSLTGTGMYSIAQMKNIKSLDLKNCLHISDQIDIVITSCPNLRELILHNCSHITITTVERFIEKAKSLPEQQFYLDVIDTNVSNESLPLPEERLKNLILLNDYEECIYDCDHGWGDQNGYNSDPEDGFNYGYDMDDLDFYAGDDNDDYYDDYGDEDIDYEFS